MYKNKTIAVVIPAYNEEILIQRTLDSIPDFVDKIIVVDDCSKDTTAQIVQKYTEQHTERFILLQHKVNQGVGGAIATGYIWCRDNKIDVTAVMAGDAQMDPNDLPALLAPIAKGEVDYTKGNRLITGEAWTNIPKVRYLGNAVLSLLTKIASGYWHVADSQTGYTATSLKVLNTLDLHAIYKKFGMPNDMLVKLNIYNFRVKDVQIRPIYGIGEKSGIRPLFIIPRMSFLIMRLFVKRMVFKYIIRDFHPLVLFYLTGIILTLLGIIFGSYVIYYRLFIGSLRDLTPLFSIFLFISGWQFTLFAMWFDMQYNKDLK